MILKSLRTWIALLLCSTMAGCVSMQDCVVDVETDVRNHVLAQKAWGEWSWCYDKLDYPMHFAKGFKDGYTNILEGGTGCQPTLPPRCYWKPHYQNAEGRGKTNAWFDGFSHGALAAQQDGHGSIGQIPISPTARANFMAKHAPQPTSPYANQHRPAPVPDAVAPGINVEIPPVRMDELSPLLPTIGSNGEPDAVPQRPYEEK